MIMRIMKKMMKRMMSQTFINFYNPKIIKIFISIFWAWNSHKHAYDCIKEKGEKCVRRVGKMKKKFSISESLKGNDNKLKVI